MNELLGPKVLCIAPTVVSFTMNTAEKANLILQPERLPCTNKLPSHGKRSMTKTAWRQEGDVTASLKH